MEGGSGACGVRKLRVVIQEKVKGAGIFTKEEKLLGNRDMHILIYVKSCHMGGELDLLYFIYIYIFFFAVLGLCCCMGFSLAAVSRGYFIVVFELLIVVASLAMEHRL